MAVASESTTACNALDVSRSRHSVCTEPSKPCTMTAAARVGNVRVMRGGVERGRGYFPSRVAKRITGVPAIKEAIEAHA